MEKIMYNSFSIDNTEQEPFLNLKESVHALSNRNRDLEKQVLHALQDQMHQRSDSDSANETREDDLSSETYSYSDAGEVEDGDSVSEEESSISSTPEESKGYDALRTETLQFLKSSEANAAEGMRLFKEVLECRCSHISRDILTSVVCAKIFSIEVDKWTEVNAREYSSTNGKFGESWSEVFNESKGLPAKRMDSITISHTAKKMCDYRVFQRGSAKIVASDMIINGKMFKLESDYWVGDIKTLRLCQIFLEKTSSSTKGKNFWYSCPYTKNFNYTLDIDASKKKYSISETNEQFFSKALTAMNKRKRHAFCTSFDLGFSCKNGAGHLVAAFLYRPAGKNTLHPFIFDNNDAHDNCYDRKQACDRIVQILKMALNKKKFKNDYKISYPEIILPGESLNFGEELDDDDANIFMLDGYCQACSFFIMYIVMLNVNKYGADVSTLQKFKDLLRDVAYCLTDMIRTCDEPNDNEFVRGNYVKSFLMSVLTSVYGTKKNKSAKSYNFLVPVDFDYTEEDVSDMVDSEFIENLEKLDINIPVIYFNLKALYNNTSSTYVGIALPGNAQNLNCMDPKTKQSKNCVHYYCAEREKLAFEEDIYEFFKKLKGVNLSFTRLTPGENDPKQYLVMSNVGIIVGPKSMFDRMKPIRKSRFVSLPATLRRINFTHTQVVPYERTKLFMFSFDPLMKRGVKNINVDIEWMQKK